MSSPADIRNTSCPSDVEPGHSPLESPMQHANTPTMQLPEDPVLGLGTHRVSIVVTSFSIADSTT